jgi:hypothetical protein
VGDQLSRRSLFKFLGLGAVGASAAALGGMAKAAQLKHLNDTARQIMAEMATYSPLPKEISGRLSVAFRRQMESMADGGTLVLREGRYTKQSRVVYVNGQRIVIPYLTKAIDV